MSFSIIVSTSKNGVIGVNNQLPWHLPEDLKHFKKITNGKTVIMGRKTYESIGRALPNRFNVILTNDKTYKAEGCEVFNTVEEIVKDSSRHMENMIIGGGEVYNAFLPLVNIIYLTEIDAEISGDTTFIIPEGFKVLSEEKINDGVLENGEKISCTFKKLQRIE